MHINKLFSYASQLKLNTGIFRKLNLFHNVRNGFIRSFLLFRKLYRPKHDEGSLQNCTRAVSSTEAGDGITKTFYEYLQLYDVRMLLLT